MVWVGWHSCHGNISFTSLNVGIFWSALVLADFTFEHNEGSFIWNVGLPLSVLSVDWCTEGCPLFIVQMQSQAWFWNENNLSKSFLCFDYILNILGLKTWIRLNFLLWILFLFPRSSLESCSSCATQKKEFMLPGSRFVSLKRRYIFWGSYLYQNRNSTRSGK